MTLGAGASSWTSTPRPGRFVSGHIIKSSFSRQFDASDASSLNCSMTRTDNGVEAGVKRRYVLGFIAAYVLGFIAILVLLFLSLKLTAARYVDVSERSPW